MAGIISYPVSSNVLETDLLLGTHLPPVIDGEGASTRNFTVGSIVSLAQAGMSNSIDLQGVLDNGSTVDFEEGGELVLLGDTPYDRRITFLINNGEMGINNQHSDTYIDVSGYEFTGYKGNGDGSNFDVGRIELRNGKIAIWEEIQSSLSDQRTSVSFEAPIAVANIKIPAKPTDGDYTLATLDDIPLAPYKVYTALLSQTGTNAPVAIVLENTLGATITWTRSMAGQYFGTTSSPLFSIDNITTSYGRNNINTLIRLDYFSNTVIILGSATVANAQSSIFSDDLLNKTSIEIRVYNTESSDPK